MLISEVLHGKGHEVVKIREEETVADAVRKLAEHKIGALVVEDRWMRMAGIFSERDFVNAMAHEGAATLQRPVRELMSSRVITCESQDRIDAVPGEDDDRAHSACAGGRSGTAGWDRLDRRLGEAPARGEGVGSKRAVGAIPSQGLAYRAYSALQPLNETALSG